MSGYDQYLSYSGRKSYLTCPKLYQYRYILKEVSKGDPRKRLFGIAIGKIFEWFYTKKIWTSADPFQGALDLIEPAIEYAYADADYNPLIDPSFDSKLRGELRQFVPSSVEIVRVHRFLTPTSQAEVDLTVDFHSKMHGITLRMGGRADFIHGTNDDIWIIDGKGSAHRERFTDSDQVIWYATQHYIKYHIAPSRLGFLYYRFPDNPIQWVAYDSQVIRDLLSKTFDVIQKIRLKQFDATPSSECHRCDYHAKCADGTKYLAERRVATGGRIGESVFHLEIID